jgi:hypothetical protein
MTDAEKERHENAKREEQERHENVKREQERAKKSG